jgi:hypothetical protein
LGIVAILTLTTPLALVAVAVLASSRCWNRGSCPGAAWASLPMQRWYPRGHCPGSVAIVAVTALASLWRWHHRGRCPGVAWALPPLRRWRPCGHPPGAVAIVASRRCHHRGAGVIADVALGLLGHHHPCGAGILADVALALLSLLPLRCWHHRGAGIIADVTLAPLGHCCHCGTGVIIDVALALLPTLPLQHLASPRLLQWRRCQRCLGTITVVALALSSLSHWHHRLGSIALATWTSVPFIGVGPLGASAAISSCCCP